MLCLENVFLYKEIIQLGKGWVFCLSELVFLYLQLIYLLWFSSHRSLGLDLVACDLFVMLVD